MSDNQKRLVLAIIEFLNQSIADGTDDKESLEVAVQCISESFGVDPSNSEQVARLSVKPATLQSIFDVYLKTKDKISPSSSQPVPPSGENKSRAEKLKQDGNSFMTSKKYDEAITAYSQAIELDPTNPIYYSNRAAAYSSKGDHLSAIGDSEMAISVDPSFVKAYHRLGHAQYSLGDFKAAADAFSRGLALDPNNAGLKTGLKNSQDRITDDNTTTNEASSTPPPIPGGAGGLADMLRGMGGGGMPDLASLMNNPQMMAMAQQMAANGGLERLMSNPSVADMMSRIQSGNMPSMQELASDPSLRDLASQFMGGGAGR